MINGHDTMSNDGATQVPSHQTDTRPECMDRWKHIWQWVWMNDLMTDRVRCTTCGVEREMNVSGRE